MGSEATGPLARFAPALDDPGTTPLGAIPFPHDHYRDAEGRLALDFFRDGPGILRLIVGSLELETEGFGTTSSLYMSFEGEIDPEQLPEDGGESIRSDASLSLIDIDPDSEERGRRWPIYWRWHPEEGDGVPAYTLQVRLLEGIALRPQTRYALVLRAGVARAAPSFQQMLAAEAPEDAALAPLWERYGALRAWLSEEGIGADELAVASTFTTQDPTGGLFAAREALLERPAPTVERLASEAVEEGITRFEVFRGSYRAPRVQEGEPPYRFDGGALRFNERGEVIIQGEEELRFSLSVPDLDPPEGGWPVILYAHGTGGDYESYRRSGIALELAQQGLAVLSMDQVHHGPRALGSCDDAGDVDSCVSLLFFNFINPVAGRDNVRQGAIDLLSLMRLVPSIELPAEESSLGRPLRLNPEKVALMGHSQGGLNGPLFLAIEPTIPGAMLSGAGSNIAISIEQKKRPIDINQLAKQALGFEPEGVLDRWHPALALLQTFIEPGDGSNYAPLWFNSPPEGYPAKSVFMTAGLEDSFTPPDTIFALAVAGRVPVIEPVTAEIAALEFLSVPPPGVPPYSANVAGGGASAGLAQFEGQGHFVIFRDRSARRRAANFLKDLVNRPLPRIF